MKVKSKVMETLGSIKDQVAIGRASITSRNILSSIETAVLRSTDSSDSPLDDKYTSEILFLISNAPGSITYLARRISTRLESNRDPLVALKTLLLLHRLLRGGDRYFEQDLRNLWSSGDLRVELRWPSSNLDPFSRFTLSYSRFLEERMGWLINQAGKLEPIRPLSCSTVSSYEEKAIESVLSKLSKCQELLHRIVNCLPAIKSRSSHAVQAVMNVVLRESFRVYESFCEGLEVVFSSFLDLKKHTRALALDILKKACDQTSTLYQFYESCKKRVVSKSLDYPSVRIVKPDEISSMEELETKELGIATSKERESKKKETEAQISYESSTNLFSQGLETKISTVWVEFDDEDDSQRSSFSFDDLIAGEGESSKKTLKSMELLWP
ncbi:uncharacterized protein A4U43_C09F4180 [Asparagus officinalis]|uniref:ENTH domain-containing protein n=1 Tax=Asparagus officinalis TaxID=4686 RepID=A0A5P1EA10_ASPOF|nr:putative clathrin assembly protein At1g33340 [Asparagus officinalis]ONK57796.1 uncharacterized protein A4U43_C09F4180 [Asparagus officinalis]